MFIGPSSESSAEPSVPVGDLGPLAWVLDETRKTVQTATKALRRFAHEAEHARGVDLASVDASQLRVARQQLHQVAGALEMVGQAVAAQMVRGMEAAAQRFIAHPESCTEAAAAALEKSGFALIEFVESQLSERPRSALGLFSHYRQVQELAGADRIHPADLWAVPWRWAEPQGMPAAEPLAPSTGARSRLDQGVLRLMRHAEPRAAADLAAVSSQLASGSAGQVASFWHLSAGFFEAVAARLVPVDLYVKRAASRVLLQYTSLARGDTTLSERLAHDLLFFCAQARPDPAAATPALAAVRHAWGLQGHAPVDYEQPAFGLYDPAVLAQARRRVESVKENWSALAGGDLARLKPSVDQLGLVVESLERLHPGSQPLARALDKVAQQVRRSGREPSAEQAMEVATAVLFLEASFAEFQPQDEAFAARQQELAARLDAAADGRPVASLQPWMEELYRRVSDRQTMGTVVGELRVTLAEVEQRLDQFFRQPDDRSGLDAVPEQLAQMRGVLSVLGLDQAALAVARMRERVDALRDEAAVPAPASDGTFERLGASLGALGFLIDTLGYQPALARKLFVYDEAQDEFRFVGGRVGAGTPAVPAAPADAGGISDAASVTSEPPHTPAQLDQVAALAALDERPALAQAASQAAEAARHDDPASLDTALQRLQAVEAASRPAPLELPAAATTSEDDDDDLLGIFLDEAREVVGAGQAALGALQHDPEDGEQLTTLRRAFHTLKGSSRMVGLGEFGAAAWSLEQLLNAWLAEHKPADDALRGVAAEALQAFSNWVEAIAGQRAGDWSAAPFEAMADALRLRGERRDLAAGAMQVGAPSGVAPQPAAGLLPEDALLDIDVERLTSPAQDVDQPPLEALSMEVPADELNLGQEPASDLAPSGDPRERLLQAFDLPDLELSEPIELTAPTPDDLVIQRADEPVADVPDLAELQLDADAFTLARDTADPVVPPEALAPLQALDFEFELPPAMGSMAVPSQPGAPEPEVSVEWPEPIASVPEDVLAAATPADDPVEPPLVMAPADADAFEPPAEALPTEAADAEPAPPVEAAVTWVGPLRISTPLFNVYLSEADQWSDQLVTDLADWGRHLDGAIPERAMARAHSLAGSSATVGFAALSELARAVEHALDRLQGQAGGTAHQHQVLAQAADEIRSLLHQFAAGLLKQPDEQLLAAVRALEPGETGSASAPTTGFVPLPWAAADREAVAGAPVEAAPARSLVEDDIDAVDAVDADLFEIFAEEADELLPQLSAALRRWVEQPHDAAARAQALRVLHTLKGSARLAGALRLGEMAHRTESAIETIGTENLVSADLEPLLEHLDRIQADFQQLRQPAGGEAPAHAVSDARVSPAAPVVAESAPVSTPVVEAMDLPDTPAAPAERSEVAGPTPFSFVAARASARQTVRVRSQLLDRLMAQAGEVMTSRARLDNDVNQLRAALAELTGNVERLRAQLRDVELQAETQMQSRLAQSRDAQQSFDPLEFDRFTRMQELTRMMAESVNDVATVQRNLQRAIEASEDELVAQTRQSRELQRDLLRTRMVEFDGASERLYRLVRQAGKEAGKPVRLDIVGGGIEIDRGILERMTPVFEHLLRNSVVHGIESPDERRAAGKDPSGVITIDVQQAGNEVSVEVRDDGRGLNRERVRQQGIERGLIRADQALDDGEIAQLVFTPGFSTASAVTGLAGRGVGLDVVRSEVQALGGSIELADRVGQGMTFRLVLPLTTAVTHVVMIRVGALVVGVPASLVERVHRSPAAELDRAYAEGALALGDERVPFFWGGAVLQQSVRSGEARGKTTPVLLLRSAAQRLALHVDEVLGNQDVVIKALGPQLSRLPGLVAITALASGAVTLIYNPVALAAVHGAQIRAWAEQAAPAATAPAGPATSQPRPVGHSDIPLVLVVDDSITVRRVTQRLLQREGYRVALAADGLQGLERLQQERPALVLSDIEMPRMDGFDFLRNIRANAEWRELPVVMITSRTAEKHQDHARQLGANHYLGKPYSEDELLGLIRGHARAVAAQPVA
ncbi:Hpt domain-containing protein [Ottowia pentelensis]|uniref:histidine kinase n=1 Tax=Ottowia pentelensis TaxID=511108 RepID=A0ABV6PSG0_9BURK